MRFTNERPKKVNSQYLVVWEYHGGIYSMVCVAQEKDKVLILNNYGDDEQLIDGSIFEADQLEYKYIINEAH